jgi:hypothetical protein
MPVVYCLVYRLHTCHVLSQILFFLFLCFVCHMRKEMGHLLLSFLNAKDYTGCCQPQAQHPAGLEDG